MLNIEAMAKMIEAEESQKIEKPQEKPAEVPGMTEERAAEMIESAINNANAQTAETIKGLTETIASLTAQITALSKGKEENENA